MKKKSWRNSLQSGHSTSHKSMSLKPYTDAPPRNSVVSRRSRTSKHDVGSSQFPLRRVHLGSGGKRQPRSRRASDMVRTPLGQVKGSLMSTRLNKTIYAFRGVRYGKSTEGERRFKVECYYEWGWIDGTKKRAIYDYKKCWNCCHLPSCNLYNNNIIMFKCGC